MFVFDALREAQASVTMETVREEEVAPVKNAEGRDSPATARRLMSEQAARRLEARGVRVPRDGAGRPCVPVEISPRFDLEAAALPDLTGLDFTRPVYLAP